MKFWAGRLDFSSYTCLNCAILICGGLDTQKEVVVMHPTWYRRILFAIVFTGFILTHPSLEGSFLPFVGIALMHTGLLMTVRMMFAQKVTRDGRAIYPLIFESDYKSRRNDS